MLLGTESDPYVDKHMFFISIGWRYMHGFYTPSSKDIIYPSHWASITSPISSAEVMYYGWDEEQKNKCYVSGALT